MKKLFIAMLAVAAVTACAKDEPISIDRQAIGFGNPFVENSVRADYSDGQDLTKFNVYGTVTGTAGTVNIFEGVEVTGNVGPDEWSYDAQYAQYWIPKADYDFAAVVDATVASKDANKMPLTLTTVADDTSNLEDMLYATAHVEDATADQGAVNFNFSHLLSKVHFTVTSNALGGYYHTVTGIKVSNFESGTYTINGGTWAGTTAKDVTFAEIAEVTDESGAKSNADLLLVPNAATFNVTFTVDLYKNGTKLGTETKTVAVDTALVKGNSYNFTIDCKVGNPIKFTVTNDPTWASQPDVTVQ
jgi:hypothetical protein